MSRETWYVMEDGSVTHPREVAPDANGILRTKDGLAVAMRGDVPRSRGVDVDDAGERIVPKNMKPAPSGFGYTTREMSGSPESANLGQLDHDGDGRPGGSSKPQDGGDLAALRAEYQTKFGKRPFAGWDEATLRDKIAAAD